MAKITIGGVEHTIDEMNFVAVEMAWPFIEQAMATVHPIAGTNAALAVIAAGLMESEGYDCQKWDIEPTGIDDEGKSWPRHPSLIHIDMTERLRRKLKANEIGSVKLCLFDLIREAGFDMATAGELQLTAEEEAVNHLMETATSTSPSLSQPESREVAGTA